MLKRVILNSSLLLKEPYKINNLLPEIILNALKLDYSLGEPLK